jgi:hypothetical protein
LKDLNGGNSNYVIDLTVLCKDNLNSTKKNSTSLSPFKSSEKPPLPFIARISNAGRVYVKFPEALEVVNASKITNGTLFIEGKERPFLDVKIHSFD